MLRVSRLVSCTGLLLLAALPLGAAEVDTEIDAAPGGVLELDLRTGASLDISGWNRDVVSITGEIQNRRGDSDDIELQVQDTANGVRVTSRFSRHSGRNSSSGHLVIKVPDRFDIEIDSMGGDVSIENVEGSISGKTMGGGLDLAGLTGEIDLTTMGGKIRLEDSELDGKLHTMGGAVVFQNVSGDVRGSTNGGEVFYKNVSRGSGRSVGRGGTPVEISTMGGRINVDEAPAGADVHTMGGNIQIGSAREFVKAKTMGGDLTIEEVDGWVKATTMAGDVEVTMVGDPGSGRRDVDLTSMSGDISLTLPAGMDMEIEIELAYTKNSRRDYRIVSDYDLDEEETDTWDYDNGTPRKYILGTGKVGSGKHRILIRTINGNVYLKEGR